MTDTGDKELTLHLTETEVVVVMAIMKFAAEVVDDAQHRSPIDDDIKGKPTWRADPRVAVSLRKVREKILDQTIRQSAEYAEIRNEGR